MKEYTYTILSNMPLTNTVFQMKLGGSVSEITAPGMFVNIKIKGLYLRRPISVCDKEDGILTIIYKTVGEGTIRMSRMKPGETLDILTGLGNGFDTSLSGKTPALVGGGAGIPPLYLLAKRLIAEGKKPHALLGFNTKQEIFLENAFRSLKIPVTVTTADGSCGVKGFVTESLKNTRHDYYFACGPEPMLKAVYRASSADGQMSFERRMGCGFGACMGCSCRTVSGYKRICKDGPVLKKEEILWED